MNYDELKPGRALDALVAEKVMGLEVEKDRHTKGLFANPQPDDPEDYYVGKSNERIKKYSTDISAAWEVVQALAKMRPECHLLRIQISPGGNYKVWVFHTIYRQPYDEFVEKLVAEIVEDTAAHAICLAALKAIGGEMNEEALKIAKRYLEADMRGEITMLSDDLKLLSEAVVELSEENAKLNKILAPRLEQLGEMKALGVKPEALGLRDLSDDLFIEIIDGLKEAVREAALAFKEIHEDDCVVGVPGYEWLEKYSKLLEEK